MEKKYMIRMYTNREGWKYITVNESNKFVLQKKRPDDSNYTTFTFREIKEIMKDFRKDSDYMLKCGGVPKALRSIIMLGRFDKSLQFYIIRMHNVIDYRLANKIAYEKKLEKKAQRKRDIIERIKNDIEWSKKRLEDIIQERTEEIREKEEYLKKVAA